MSLPLLIWCIVALSYVVFYCWYIGFKRRLQREEIDAVYSTLKPSSEAQVEHLNTMRTFFEQDDGRDFVMVNMLLLKHPLEKARQQLATYQSIFMRSLLKRAGHPILFGRVTGDVLDSVACDDEQWSATFLVRYRCRRDLLHMLPETLDSAHHALKLASLDRTFAMPATPWHIMGGPKWIVPLLLLLIGALAHLSVAVLI